MNSMTGFGRGEAEKDGRCITIEMKSVNHRYLDINLRMPRLLFPLEEYARKRIKQRLARGRVEVFVNYKNVSGAAGEIRVDIPLVKRYLEANFTCDRCWKQAVFRGPNAHGGRADHRRGSGR